MKMSSSERQPHIVLVLADNLGWGELGCYGGGALRGDASDDLFANLRLEFVEICLVCDVENRE